MINRIVPMVSPFSPYVRRSEQLWMLKSITLAALAPVYHQTSQVIVALKAGVADRVYRLDEVIALESWKIRKPVQASKKRLHCSASGRNRKALGKKWS
jgi:hypothetical protein